MMMHIMGALPDNILVPPAENLRGGRIAEGDPAVAIQAVYALTCRVENHLVMCLQLRQIIFCTHPLYPSFLGIRPQFPVDHKLLWSVLSAK